MTAKEYKIALKNRPELTADDDETRTFPKWRQKFELWGEDDHDIYKFSRVFTILIFDFHQM